MSAPQTAPACAIIIPHYNDPDRLARCLEALAPQVEGEVEVVVADNGSEMPPDAVLARFPFARMVHEPESGAGLARNRGVAESTAPVLLFIDADCLPAPDWVATGHRIARAGHVIGGRVDVFHETPPPRSGAEAFEDVFAFRMRDYLERDAFLGSGNLALFRDTFEAVGGFRPAVSEDKEWSQRAAASGMVLGYEDGFVVAHPSRSDWAALRRKWRRLTEESFALHVQRGGGRLAWALRGLAMPASAVVHTARFFRQADMSHGERGRGIITLHKLRWLRMVWMLGQSLSASGGDPST